MLEQEADYDDEPFEGHRVVYASYNRARHTVEGLDIEFIELEPDRYQAFLKEDSRRSVISRITNLSHRRGQATAAMAVEGFVERVRELAPDLLLIDAGLPSPLAPHNMADQLLLWRNPDDLRGVMCAGRWLQREGQIVGQDPEAIRERVAAAAASLWGA